MTERPNVTPLLPSALHRAVMAHDRDTLERLLDEGANPATGDPWAGVLALAVQEAIRSTRDDLVQWLVTRCPDLVLARNARGEGVLHRWAAHDGATARGLRLWVDLHPPEVQAPLEAQDTRGNTPLLTAAVQPNLDAIRVLVRAGANVQHVNHQGESALMRAVLAWHDQELAARTTFPATLRLLLDAGVDPLLEDEDGVIASQRLGRQTPATPLYLELRDAEEMRKSAFYQDTLNAMHRSLGPAAPRTPRPRR